MEVSPFDIFQIDFNVRTVAFDVESTSSDVSGLASDVFPKTFVVFKMATDVGTLIFVVAAKFWEKIG